MGRRLDHWRRIRQIEPAEEAPSVVGGERLLSSLVDLCLGSELTPSAEVALG